LILFDLKLLQYATATRVDLNEINLNVVL